jgi:hypothetical protein
MSAIPFDDCQGCASASVCAEDNYNEMRNTPKGEHCKYMRKSNIVNFGKNPRILRADIMKDETKPTFEGNRVKQSTKDHDKVSLQFPGIGEGGRPDGTTSDSMRLDNIQRIPEVRISAGYVSDLITYEEHPLSSSEEKDRRYKNDL